MFPPSTPTTNDEISKAVQIIPYANAKTFTRTHYFDEAVMTFEDISTAIAQKHYG